MALLVQPPPRPIPQSALAFETEAEQPRMRFGERVGHFAEDAKSTGKVVSLPS